MYFLLHDKKSLEVITPFEPNFLELFDDTSAICNDYRISFVSNNTRNDYIYSCTFVYVSNVHHQFCPLIYNVG